MNKSKRFLAVASVVAGGCVLFGGFLAKPVVAQLRAAFVKDLNNAAYQPFAADSGIKSFPSNVGSIDEDLLTVPAGKRAVIEHFSCIDFLTSTNNFVRMELRYTVGGTNSTHEFVHTNVGGSFVSGVDVFSLSQPVQAYADPSTTISVFASRRSSTGTGGIECKISGHYVDTTP